MAQKALWGANSFLQAMFVPALVLSWGNVTDGLDIWVKKSLTYLENLELPSTKSHPANLLEIYTCMMSAIPALLMVSRFNDVHSLFQAYGFTWSEDGDECLEVYISAGTGVFPFIKKEDEWITNKLCVFLAAPKGTIDEAKVNAWMPTPEYLAEIQGTNVLYRAFCFTEAATLLGAQAFLKLGREDDAYEVARLACLQTQSHKITTYILGNSIMGQIEAKRGNLDKSEELFAVALEKAKLISEMPMFEVLVARDRKKHLLEPNGRDCTEADAIIEAACSRMNKTREQIKTVLEA